MRLGGTRLAVSPPLTRDRGHACARREGAVNDSVMLIGAGASRAGDGVVVQPGGSSVTVQPGQPSVTVQPAPSASISSAPATLQADEIKAHEVRAQTIYANKIESPSIQGTVHQSDTVKVDKTKGDIETPSVVAEHIYVRELKKD